MQIESEMNKYDFRIIGQAIKEARLKRKLTREKLSQEINLAPRYIMSIENKGQHPSLQVFFDLMLFFNISVDQFLFSKTNVQKSTLRRQLEATLDGLDEKDFVVLQATANGLKEIKDA